MDIRVQAYRPVTVQSFGGQGGRAVAVSDARNSSPVTPVAPVSGNRASLQQLASQLQQATQNGYTDAVRGSKINILA